MKTGPWFGRQVRVSEVTGSLIASAVAGQGPSASHQYAAIGMAPNARVLSLQIPPNSLDGTWQANEARAIRYAAKHGAQVVYLGPIGPDSTAALDSAVLFAESKGVVLIGDSYRWPGAKQGTYSYPGSLPGVLTDSAVRLPGLTSSCSGRYRPPRRGLSPWSRPQLTSSSRRRTGTCTASVTAAPPTSG